jgi:hypothetical protein
MNKIMKPFLFNQLPIELKLFISNFLSIQERYGWTSKQINSFSHHIETKMKHTHNIYYYHFRHLPYRTHGSHNQIIIRRQKNIFQINISIFTYFDETVYNIIVYQQWYKKNIYLPLTSQHKQKLRYFYFQTFLNKTFLSIFNIDYYFTKNTMCVVLRFLHPSHGYNLNMPLITCQNQLQMIVQKCKQNLF